MTTTYAPHWTSTTPAKDLDYRCDHCGAPANTLHFVPWVGGRVPEAVLFACSDHDPGGYWTELALFFDKKERFPQHIEGKHGGPEALELLELRIHALKRDKAASEKKEANS